MSTISPHYRTVQQLLQTQSFAIDEYQREYKWDKENIEELLDDLQTKFLSCYTPGDDTRKVTGYEEYFLGSIIISKRNGKNYLIDGQQRVTSLTLLLIYLYRIADQRGLTLVQTIAPLIYSDNLGQPCFNLDIPERLPVIEALFRGQPFNPDGQDESIQTMYARYQDIEQYGFLEELGENFPHFVYWLLTKVGLIEIATDSDNFAYAIFETMNDRGKPLSPVDMLKAYLLAPIDNPDQRRRANQTWKDQILDLISWDGGTDRERDSVFMKAWIRSQYAETIRERKAGALDKDWELIGTVFHRWVRDNKNRLNLDSEAENLRLVTVDLPFFAKAYLKIQAASKRLTPGLESVFYNAQNEFTWQSTALLAPLCVTDDEETVRKKIAVTATYLDIWVMRRAVNYIRVNYTNASYGIWSLCGAIRRKPLDQLVPFLYEKLKEDDVTFQGWPERKREGIKRLTLNLFSRRYIFHLLARLTAYTEIGSGRTGTFEQFVDRSLRNPFDIEHIWPNDFTRHASQFASEVEFDDLRNHVAALVLLPADVNRSLQDKPFEEKVAHYARQNIFAASLSPAIYQHQPQFAAFCKRESLPFEYFTQFGKNELQRRLALIETLVDRIWSPERIKQAAQ